MKTLSAAKPITFENKTIIPIEETVVYKKSVFDNHFIYGSKKPGALIILSDGIPKAYNMQFEEISIEHLIEETKGLKELMNNV